MCGWEMLGYGSGSAYNGWPNLSFIINKFQKKGEEEVGL